jgi:S-(hydroxymethyl)glutathione dehydrogenase/alcohol dehydrogenase
VAAIRELTSGRGAEFTIVAVGHAGAIQQAWESLAPGGTCVVIGAPPTGQTVAIDPVNLYRDEKRLTGSRYGSSRPLDDFGRLVDLYLGGKLELDALISRQYTLAEVNEAHRALAAAAHRLRGAFGDQAQKPQRVGQLGEGEHLDERDGCDDHP